MILHIIPNEKFTYDYITKINSLFDEKEHIFIVCGRNEFSEIKLSSNTNVFYTCNMPGIKKYIFILNNIIVSKAVILHSLLFSSKILFVIAFSSIAFGSKMFWNIWGADLYNSYWYRNNSKKAKRKEFYRRIVIRNIDAVGDMPADYRFLLSHYKTNAKFYYASYWYDFLIEKIENVKKSKKTKILLGNSATKECQHKEIIDKLSQYTDVDFSVYCVLSYPSSNSDYINEIINYGNEKLGSKFIPLTGFLEYSKYVELLNSVDIAIFNHNRQQAFGNIATLLYLGKTVYVNPMNCCKEYFENLGCVVCSTEELNINSFDTHKINKACDANREAIIHFFSENEFRKRWEKIFTEVAK